MTPEIAATWQAWAAVVQAVGSVVAIGVAIAIARNQHEQNVKLIKDERARVEQGDKDKRRAIRGLAGRITSDISDHIDQVLIFHDRLNQLIRDDDERFSIDDAVGDLVGAVQDLRRAYDVANWEIKELKPIFQNSGILEAVYHYMVDAVLKDIANAAGECVAHVESSNYGFVQLDVDPFMAKLRSLQVSLQLHLQSL
ncbi:hypothetical protein [Xanthomonas cucurbitae]|uniref:Uncharacterized protein n=1 Tax=Xanthomonas cucurbitae TaxID=56453 RepID=A0ABY7YG95_9XANT|nr:hypothetical protein [Xanthomonas cucurbitae]WDM68913.1 hypothetical protein K6981_06500 [Xanthomonas cucurbitae]WDM72786.1 hypothetical protein K6978_06485 [Xanthomonas cucurbitae]